MVGYAGSPTRTVYVDVTLTRSKVKVKVTGLLNFRKLAKPCMLAVMTAAPLRGFLVTIVTSFLFVKYFMQSSQQHFIIIVTFRLNYHCNWTKTRTKTDGNCDWY